MTGPSTRRLVLLAPALAVPAVPRSEAQLLFLDGGTLVPHIHGGRLRGLRRRHRVRPLRARRRAGRGAGAAERRGAPRDGFAEVRCSRSKYILEHISSTDTDNPLIVRLNKL